MKVFSNFDISSDSTTVKLTKAIAGAVAAAVVGVLVDKGFSALRENAETDTSAPSEQ